MAYTYTRQSTISDGDTITAALFNNEYNQLLNAFAYSSSDASATGHRHDGSAAQGGNIGKIGDLDFLNKIEVDSTNNRWGIYVEVSSSAVEQIRIQDGAIVPVTDNDIDLGTSSLEFKDLYLDGTAYLDTISLNGTAITSTAAEINILDGVTSTAAELNILDGVTSTATELNVMDGDTSASSTTLADADRVVVNDNGTMKQVALTDFETYFEAALDTGTNLTTVGALNAGSITSGFGAIDIGSSNLTATGTISLGATSFNDNNITNVGSIQLDSIAGDGDTNTSIAFSGSDVITITTGGTTAFTLDASQNAVVGANLTVTGDLTISGDDLVMGTNTSGMLLIADGTNFNPTAVGSLSEISSVANDDVLLAVDTSGGGLKKIARSTLVSGLATSSALSNVVEDTSPQLGGNLDTNSHNILIDDAHFIGDENGNEQIIFQTTSSAVNQFDITNAATGNPPKLSATGGDSNIDLDIEAKGTGHVTIRGNTNAGAIQLNCESNSHGQIIQSQPHSAAVTNTMLLPAGSSSTLVSLVSTDTLTNKTLTSPVLNTATVGTSIVPASADGATLGTASAEFSDIYLADSSVIFFGNDQEVKLIHSADKGLILKHTATADDKPVSLTLQTGETDIAANDVLGKIDFQAPDEGTGTDAILVAAGIEAVSEGDFSASANATKLSFKVAASEAAAEKMSLSSGGNLTVSGNIAAVDLDISGDVDIDGTLEADAITVNGTTLAETISDTIGAMVGSNTETGIAVTYDDSDNTLDFVLGAAQTGITSLLATDIKIGEDDETKIDFETADTINFYAGNEKQLILTDGALTPGSNAILDLGTDALEFKDAYFDGTVEADAISIAGTTITSTAAEINKLDGVTATTAEINYLDVTTLGTSEASKVVTSDANGVTKFDNAITEESTVITSAATAALNVRDGSVFTLTIAHDISTFNWSNHATSGYASSFIMKVTQDSTGNRTIAWPDNTNSVTVRWAGNTAPTLSTGAGDIDVFAFFTVDGGANYYGFTAGQDML